MAVVNSEKEAETLSYLYLNIGPAKVGRDDSDSGTQDDVTLPTETPTTEPANGKVHIGFHDIFIENEYLTVRGKYYLVHKDVSE